MQLSSLIGQIYQAGLDGQWSGVLDGIIESTASNKAFFFFQELDKPTPLLLEFRTTFDFPYEAYAAYQKRTLEDPLYQTMANMLEGDSLELTGAIDVEAFEKTAFYKDFYLPFKTKYSIASLLIRDARHESVFAINRGQEDPRYEARDLQLISLLTPHLARSIQLYRDLTLYKQYASISKSILDQTDKGILVCDAKGGVLLANESANRELAHAKDIQIQGNRLTLFPSAYDLRLQQCISQCANFPTSIDSKESILLNRPEGESLLLAVTPLNRHTEFVDINQPCCLVTLSRQNAVNWSMLAREYGLTPKELALVQAINSKKTLAQLTREQGVTHNTLATHLKAIYKKMQVHSQAQLMATLGMFRD
ncbi:helix-turn-helix transcriptional regulator [Bowmanella dokdonensis]|uniref:Helix-turn-helix transcriptional regulator n=1 Tax=Bowmanella dokdonensis TaxID=751969 RepID=A0A939IPU3_9ALTE|nr:helix-turn-helix transcriptional regulator [Bowmanella dokdonensis]